MRKRMIALNNFVIARKVATMKRNKATKRPPMVLKNTLIIGFIRICFRFKIPFLKASVGKPHSQFLGSFSFVIVGARTH